MSAEKKRAKVHLLPTNDERAVIGLTADEKTLWFAHSGVGNSYGNKHLYITTDDEIKEGDWVYALDKVFQITGNTAFGRKIIATTDPELTVNISRPLGVTQQLPQPSKAFIEKYCKVGGIDEVDVEYGLFHDGNFKDDDETHAFKATRKPRVNSHNEIIIHSIDDVDDELKLIKGEYL